MFTREKVISWLKVRKPFLSSLVLISALVNPAVVARSLATDPCGCKENLLDPLLAAAEAFYDAQNDLISIGHRNAYVEATAAYGIAMQAANGDPALEAAAGAAFDALRAIIDAYTEAAYLASDATLAAAVAAAWLSWGICNAGCFEY